MAANGANYTISGLVQDQAFCSAFLSKILKPEFINDSLITRFLGLIGQPPSSTFLDCVTGMQKAVGRGCSLSQESALYSSILADCRGQPDTDWKDTRVPFHLFTSRLVKRCPSPAATVSHNWNGVGELWSQEMSHILRTQFQNRKEVHHQPGWLMVINFGSGWRRSRAMVTRTFCLFRR